ncbi:2-C-methyl-D-erythritol 4-phosphate cytidylyltransferase / 2-C-methyl-D-erythritol 2,4-cyclodiphosphate synthase [hydrothermal vent metagenome]|uniref:2-C-methyl-D-erythritol 4-phosphate cytidylyltransferase / 2-C-methyl-D-erythritol 2,4-cyclodiphosphate synthase n=1 Tax=hydrothermal vent metagenome TaxID=652676 RepID=A0A3B0SJU5_9ZZZZ
MKVAVLIVAAGRGHRLGADLPKQYITLAGKSVLHRTIEAFQQVPYVDLIQTVIHRDDHDLYRQAAGDLDTLPPVNGGGSRQQSVMKGLQSLGVHEPDLVLIHDAARPFISPKQIENIIMESAVHGAIIPVLPMTDTIKKVSGDNIKKTIERHSLARAQTPQAFRFKLIFMAHRKMEGQEMTDDSAIAEACGIQVKTIPGDEDNFKITTQADLIKAEYMIKSTLTDIRTGLGYDVHAFEDGNQVILGGISIDHDRKLKGHSDADVALHALTDALLGSIGEGDIGTHFPPGDMQWRGASSEIFLKHAAKLLSEKGGIIANLDLTLICEAPKIMPHSAEIRDNIARILELAPDRVSIKATTTEKLGFTGRGEGIAAQAIITVRLPE